MKTSRWAGSILMVMTMIVPAHGQSRKPEPVPYTTGDPKPLISRDGINWRELLGLSDRGNQKPGTLGLSLNNPFKRLFPPGEQMRFVDPDLYSDLARKKSPDAPDFSEDELAAQLLNIECNPARAAFERLFLAMQRDYGSDFMSLPGASTVPDGRLKPFFQAAMNYDRACLAGQAAIPAALKRAGVENIVGVVRNKGLPYCTGFRVQRNTIATARHCFFQRETNAMHAEIDYKAVSFSFAGDGWRQHSVKALAHGRQFAGQAVPGLSFATSDDYIFLKTETIQLPMPEIDLAQQPKGRDELFVYGFYRYHDAAERVAGVKLDATGDQGMRWTRAGGCIVGATTARCIYHGCQTLEGFSGAPLIKRGNQQSIVMLGIHVAGVSPDKVCPAGPVRAQGNVGIPLPQDLKIIAAAPEAS